MTSIRRNTPLVPCPQPGSPRAQQQQRACLKAPIVIVAAGKEWELCEGTMYIGRDPNAHIALEGPLVSRMHASISVAPNGEVSLEDLHSTNGVFVNGSKLSRPRVPLYDGDRLLIGTTEISVFGLRSSTTVRVDTDATEPRRPPASDTLRSRPNPDAPAVDVSMHRPTITTGRTAAIDLVGSFAEQMMKTGHPLEAVRTLSEPLQNLLKGASAGLAVPSNILQSATNHAIRLRSWTQRDTWIDYVFELHLASQQVPTPAVLQLLEQVVAEGARVDRSLVRYLAVTLERRATPATGDEAACLARLKRIAE